MNQIRVVTSTARSNFYYNQNRIIDDLHDFHNCYNELIPSLRLCKQTADDGNILISIFFWPTAR